MFNSTCVEVTTAYFSVLSDAVLTISEDADNASIVTGLTIDGKLEGWEVDDTHNALRNVSGRTLSESIGLFSLHKTSANNSDKILKVYSETSNDNGVTWVVNNESGRTIGVSGQTEDFESLSSEAFNVLDNSMVRFRFFADGSDVSLTPVSFVVNGETVIGPSFRWRLGEVRLT